MGKKVCRWTSRTTTAQWSARALINSQLIGTEKTSDDHVGHGGKTTDHFPVSEQVKVDQIPHESSKHSTVINVFQF